jgi:riboflavin synthase
MFTGLIEEIGTVRGIVREGSGYKLTVSCCEVLDGVRRGDSIAVDGACQTVESFDADSFSVFVSEVTAGITTLASFRPGHRVNLEQAMRADGRFGGHMVQGHVDGTGIVRTAVKDASGLRLNIECDSPLMRHIIAKGSVCVNGVSLTVVEDTGSAFSLYLIPETLDRTTLPLLSQGAKVNIETDLVAKYLEKLLPGNKKAETDSSLLSALAENGFM